MTITRAFLRKVFAVALLASCASGPRPHPESSQRVPDSAPERLPARGGAPGLRLEEDDERWGMVAARQRRERAEQKNRQPSIPPVAPGPVNLDSSPDAGLR